MICTTFWLVTAQMSVGYYLQKYVFDQNLQACKKTLKQTLYMKR